MYRILSNKSQQQCRERQQRRCLVTLVESLCRSVVGWLVSRGEWQQSLDIFHRPSCIRWWIGWVGTLPLSWNVNYTVLWRVVGNNHRGMNLSSADEGIPSGGGGAGSTIVHRHCCSALNAGWLVRWYCKVATMSFALYCLKQIEIHCRR